uniref:Serine-threonine/tyrosine-protein kinase catalytic domain-containing protein n=1 Tax=Oryzias melastigma TaxID=30732 RepID=A0A3B3D9I3_ORYME
MRRLNRVCIRECLKKNFLKMISARKYQIFQTIIPKLSECSCAAGTPGRMCRGAFGSPLKAVTSLQSSQTLSSSLFVFLIKLHCLCNGHYRQFFLFPLHSFTPPDSEDDVQEPLAVVGSPYWMAPEVLRGEIYIAKVDVFAYGIILCEIIARIQADPDILPRTEDFGLDVEAFQRMVEDCPLDFLEMAISCCNLFEFPAKQTKYVFFFILFCFSLPSVLSPAIDYSRRRSLHFFPDSHLSRSKSDMLHNLDTFPGPQAPPARVNPFSQREDLKGGKIKLFDTPSKSVISLTFTLPPPPYCDDRVAPETGKSRGHRRCHSLPCTPPPHLTSAPNSGEGRSREEPMDCSSSPDTQDASSPYSKPPTPPSQSSTPFQPSTPPLSNGWGSAVSNGPPCLPPLPSLDNHNVVVSRPLGWTAAAKSPNNNGYHSPPSDPAGSSLFGSGSGHSLDQEVISCPGCCLAGFRFPSLCLRAPPTPKPLQELERGPRYSLI